MNGKNHKSFALTLVEHKTKYTLTALLQNNTKEHVAQIIISLIKQIKIPIKTITSDNGLEFADHQVVQKLQM